VHLPVHGVGVGEGPACAQYLPPVLVEDRRLTAVCPPHTSNSLPLHTAVCRYRPTGALAMLVAVQLFVSGLYLPPVLKMVELSHPPQTIISLLVQTAVCEYRPSGALVRLVGVHISAVASYRAPVFKKLLPS
jgi:hypothetical protein